MNTLIFRKAVFFSMLGHLAAFSVLGFSFGRQLPDLGRTSIAFWGSMLEPYDFLSNARRGLRHGVETAVCHLPVLPQEKKIGPAVSVKAGDLKPHVTLSLGGAKETSIAGAISNPPPLNRRESVVMLYPELPYHFNLYFKDRQVAHIALEYNVIDNDKVNTILIRRKISSGNLEADLLCMRYINLYLSMQQDRFVPNKWRSLKIELETKK